MRGFISKNGRSVAVGQKVKVYRNLHNGLWSLKDVESGLVLGYCEQVTLQGLQASRRKRALTTFTVSKAGRARVLREKKKTVHAYVIGHLESFAYEQLESAIYYNPYKVSSFVSENKAVYHARRVSLDASGGVVTATL